MSEKKIKSEYQKKIKLLQKHNLLYYDKSNPKISDKDYDNLKNYFGFFIFCLGFGIIIFSELSYKFVNSNIQFEIISLLLPFIFIILFYIFILIKTNFNLRLL